MSKALQTTGILRGDIKVLRGESLLLFDPAADTYYKISERTADIIAHFSEEKTLDEMVDKLREKGIETNAGELMQICSFLRASGLLVPRYGENAIRREQYLDLKKKTLLLRISSSYLFLKFPPWRPEKLFSKIGPGLSFLVSPQMMVLWCLPALWGYLLALRDGGRVLEQFADTLSWSGLAKYVLAVVAVKLIHEAAHSLAAMRFNCRVRGIGVGLIFFVPRLYTDTTDSWKLPRKKRLLIDGAGIIAELIIGGAAALAWNMSVPGVWQSTMFYIFTASTLSTLLINGNVFIRYDGYYILSDLLGIENLMGRASEAVKSTWRWYFLRVGAPSDEKRKILLISYGIAAFVYRIFLYTSICILIYFKFIKVLAVALLIMEIYTLLLHPLAGEIKTVWKLSKKSAGKAVWLILAFIFILVMGILFIPLSWGIALPGETVPVRRTSVLVKESGYLKAPLPVEIKGLKTGSAIAELESPQLEFSIEKVRRTSERDRIIFAMQQMDPKEFPKTSITAQKLQADRLALKEVWRRRETLTLKAPSAGNFVSFFHELSPGTLLKRNTQIGEIVSPENTIYAYAADDQVGKIYPGQKGTAVFPDLLRKIPCRVKSIDPVAARLKNSPVLQIYGGPVAAYPVDQSEYSTVQTLYRIELDVLDANIISGRSVKVKLSHSEQLYTHISKLLLSFLKKEF